MSQTTAVEPGYFSRVEAARYLGVSLRLVDASIARGALPVVRLGRLVRIPRAALAPAALAATPRHETPCPTSRIAS